MLDNQKGSQDYFTEMILSQMIGKRWLFSKRGYPSLHLRSESSQQTCSDILLIPSPKQKVEAVSLHVNCIIKGT